MPQARSASVPLRYVRTLLRVAEEQGYDLASIAKQLNLPPEFTSPRADLTAEVPADYYNRAYTFVMDMLQDESLGISMRHPAVSGSFRMTCLYLIHCSDLEHALQRATEFQNFCRSMMGQPQSYRQALLMLNEEQCLHLFPDSVEFAAQDSDMAWYAIAHTMAVWRRFCSWLIGSQIALQEVHIQLPPPQASGSLKQIFECPVRFAQAHNGFVFDRRYLGAKLVHDEESLKNFLRNAPYHLLANTEVESDDGIVTQMRRIVGNDLSREFPSVVDMANNLHMSVRTLRRRLKEIDTTYQEFKDQTRRDAAAQLLNRPEIKINAVAALLGFDEPSAFHRSFKKWTGQTPGDYRKSLQD